MSITSQSPKPKRRWYQFSLRTLLVVITVATLAFGGWVQFRRQRAQENRDRMAALGEAVAAIWEAGGTVGYQGGWTGKPVYQQAGRPTWLQKQFNDPGRTKDSFDRRLSVSVDFTRSRVHDADLEHLNLLPQLTRLDLKSTSVTDAGLTHLKGLACVERIDLRNTRVTAAGAKKLRKALPNCVIVH